MKKNKAKKPKWFKFYEIRGLQRLDPNDIGQAVLAADRLFSDYSEDAASEARADFMQQYPCALGVFDSLLDSIAECYEEYAAQQENGRIGARIKAERAAVVMPAPLNES